MAGAATVAWGATRVDGRHRTRAHAALGLTVGAGVAAWGVALWATVIERSASSTLVTIVTLHLGVAAIVAGVAFAAAHGWARRPRHPATRFLSHAAARALAPLVIVAPLGAFILADANRPEGALGVALATVVALVVANVAVAAWWRLPTERADAADPAAGGTAAAD